MTIHYRAIASVAHTLAGALAFAGLTASGGAHASCAVSPANQPLTASQIMTLLTGNTVCASRGNERWQELHQANGDVIDFKRGPGHAVDPSEKVGTWSATGGSGNPRVNYSYGPGNSHSYQVFANGGTSYSFCLNGTELMVNVKPGGGACP